MVYRKLYGWAIAVFFLIFFLSFFISYFVYLLWLVLGLTGNYLYYKHAKKKILKLKAKQTFPDSTQMSAALEKIGGVNFGAMVVAILAYLIILLISIMLTLLPRQ